MNPTNLQKASMGSPSAELIRATQVGATVVNRIMLKVT
jgi:hypothetical protein